MPNIASNMRDFFVDGCGWRELTRVALLSALKALAFHDQSASSQ